MEGRLSIAAISSAVRNRSSGLMPCSWQNSSKASSACVSDAGVDVFGSEIRVFGVDGRCSGAAIGPRIAGDRGLLLCVRAEFKSRGGLNELLLTAKVVDRPCAAPSGPATPQGKALATDCGTVRLDVLVPARDGPLSEGAVSMLQVAPIRRSTGSANSANSSSVITNSKSLQPSRTAPCGAGATSVWSSASGSGSVSVVVAKYCEKEMPSKYWSNSWLTFSAFGREWPAPSAGSSCSALTFSCARVYSSLPRISDI